MAQFSQVVPVLPLAFFLAGFIPIVVLWWFLSSQTKRHQQEISYLQNRIEFLEKELYACRTGRACTHHKTAQLPGAAALPQFADFAKDDLKIVEGIGPKIEELLHKAGIFSFEQLAATSTKDIRSILEKAGSRFLMHDPTTWPDQARMAHEGKWDVLKRWQSQLNKGRIVGERNQA